MMLANTMVLGVYEQGSKLAGVFTVPGFAVCVWIIDLEHVGAGQGARLRGRTRLTGSKSRGHFERSPLTYNSVFTPAYKYEVLHF
jgi:hypothetical protein